MISATSMASSIAGLSAYSMPLSGSGEDVQRIEKEISATKSEIGNCECEDTKKQLEAELQSLQAELASAKAKENTSGANDNNDPRSAGNQNENDDYQKIFSGESDRIGTINFDETTPFGERIAYF